METGEELVERARRLAEEMKSRRSARSYSQKPIPLAVVKDCVSIAASAPSGANMQPWSFVIVRDDAMKSRIRRKAEAVEREFYAKKATDEWRSRLEPLKTDAEKAFLEEAPYLICIFAQKHGIDGKGNRITHYYPLESVGIATGFLIAALHLLGISSLTYTPAPLGFLSKLLERPRNEKPYMILAVGYPNPSYSPPALQKKTEGEFLTVV
jgi:iodotyrosine deiodinase